jgi:hypothetical protein
MPPTARVGLTALYTRRAVRRVLRILTSGTGTARGTVSLYDGRQLGAP